MLRLAATGVNLRFSAIDYVPDVAVRIVQSAVSNAGHVYITNAGTYIPDVLVRLAGAGGSSLTLEM